MEDRLASQEADLELLTAVKAGDTDAYRGLVEKYQGRIYAVVFGMVRNQEVARDIAQDTFVKAYRSLDSFRLESSFYTWLYRIAMNLAIDLTRKGRRQATSSFDEAVAQRDGEGIDDPHHQDSPAMNFERKQLYAVIMDSLDKLPDDQKQILLLRELEGMSYKDISDLLDIPEGTVMSRLFYARKKMQKLLINHAP